MSDMRDVHEMTPLDPPIPGSNGDGSSYGSGGDSNRSNPEQTDPTAPGHAVHESGTAEPAGEAGSNTADQAAALTEHTGTDPVAVMQEEAADIEPEETYTDEETAELRNIVESLVFASDEPIAAKFIRQIIDEVNKDRVEDNRIRATTEGIKRAVTAINRTHADRAFHIIPIAGGFTFATKAKYSAFVGKLAKEKARRKLSATAIESLAIIAYKQPITKSEIEFIRGVNADYIIKTLLEKNLISITGRASTPGRPLLYGTTDEFLKHFGLNEITDLPKPREIEELIGETELEVEKRLLAEQQELEFKEELSQKMDGGAPKAKAHGPRPPLRQQPAAPVEKGAEPPVSTPPADSASPSMPEPEPPAEIPTDEAQQVASMDDEPTTIETEETAAPTVVNVETDETHAESLLMLETEKPATTDSLAVEAEEIATAEAMPVETEERPAADALPGVTEDLQPTEASPVVTEDLPAAEAWPVVTEELPAAEPMAEEDAIPETEIPADLPIESSENVVMEQQPTVEEEASHVSVDGPAMEPSVSKEDAAQITHTETAAAGDASAHAEAGEQDGEQHAHEKGWSKWKTKIKTFFKKLFE